MRTLLIRGSEFHDRKLWNYWGRIPDALEEKGCDYFLRRSKCLGAVNENAAFVAKNLDDYIKKTGCGKVNIIAHSKGGIEARYIIAVPLCIGEAITKHRERIRARGAALPRRSNFTFRECQVELLYFHFGLRGENRKLNDNGDIA